jgi:hypothetical protein
MSPARFLVLASAAFAFSTFASAHGVAATAASVVVPAAAPAAAPSPPKPVVASSVRDLTMQLVDVASQLGAAGPAQQGALLGQLLAIAKQRHDAMVALLPVDPAEVLRVAMPDGVLANLPPQAIPFLERQADESGTLEVYHVDHVNPADDYYLHFLNSAHGRFSLHFVGEAPDHPTGASVRVQGVRLDSAIVLAAGGGGVTLTASAPLSNTLGAQKTLVILVSFADDVTQPFTQATAQSTVFGTTSNYDYENSYQQTTLAGDVTPWVRIATKSTDANCPYSTIASQADQAATAAGYALSNYSRKVYAFYAQSSCSWWGLGSVGGNPSQAWIQSKWGFTLPVIGHEMGHNFGLYHAHSLDCGAVSLDGNTANCAASEYGDIFDMMGSSNNTPHFNAFMKERLGWLNAGVSPPLVTVSPQAGTQTFTITPTENLRDTTPRALKIVRGGSCSSTSDYFYVEARQAKGFDAFLTNYPNVPTGVLVHYVSGGSANGSYLLDMTPATSSWGDPALAAGQAFTDPVTGLTIQPVSVGSAGATVNVTYGGAACTPAAPSVAVTPTGTVWTSAGATATYSVTVTNMDSCGCSATSYDVAAAVPSGWSAIGSRTASVSPGGKTSASVAVTTAAGASPAFYTVTLDAANVSAPALMTTAGSTVAVASSLGVTVASNRTSYVKTKKNGTITATITTAVQNAGVAVSGAAVTVTVTDPAGKATTLSGTTDSTGMASVSYAMNSRTAPAGTYQVTSKATIASVSGTATTSFTLN